MVVKLFDKALVVALIPEALAMYMQIRSYFMFKAFLTFLK